jgi:signal transduction histidine kinase
LHNLHPREIGKNSGNRMKNHLRILCLEDLEDDYNLINRILKKSGLAFVSKRVDTKAEYEEALATYDPQVVLSDHALPQFNSSEALKICQKKHLQVPFILVTGAVSEEFAVNCIKEGADDYILKTNLSRLPSAINNALKFKEMARAKENAITALGGQNQELLKVNRELDSFVYSVSHNLRAPLLSVLGLLNLTKFEDSLEVLRNYHEMMRSSVLKLDETLREVLEFSKNARHDITISSIDLRHLVDECLEKLKYIPGRERLSVSISFEGEQFFYSDYYRVWIIVNNIVSNAVKYQDYTKPISYLKIKFILKQTHAFISFEDNGIGIYEELISEIFKMFFRATDKNEGSGLGLYIVKEAVDRVQGEINVESEHGKGTTFNIKLPNHNLIPILRENDGKMENDKPA